MYEIRDKNIFISQYKSFIKVKEVLYHHLTCGYVQRTEGYEELVYSLSSYIDNKVEKYDVESIEREFNKSIKELSEELAYERYIFRYEYKYQGEFVD